MRSKHLSVRKCIDKKPDKIKGIVCICIILAVVCAGNMIQNYLISLKAAKIAKTSTTISNCCTILPRSCFICLFCFAVSIL